MPKTNHKFQENEKVLCYHGPLLYEAKVQKSKEGKDKEGKDKIIEYLVHYLGWSKNWDEWVPEDRVCKINETSLQKQKELKDAQSKSNKNKSSTKKKPSEVKDVMITSPLISTNDKLKSKVSNVSNVNVNSPISSELKDNSNVIKDIDGQRKKRIKVEPNVEGQDSILTKDPNVFIDIPNLLKQSLVNDWEQIQQRKLVRLPSKVTINRIIDDYLQLKLNQKLSLSKESAIREGVEGIKEYFNASLATKLLYPFERNQYKDLIKDPEEDPKPSAIYGGIHLLRLFGELLSYLNLDEKSINLIMCHINQFLRYLEQNPSLFTSNEYESATNEYIKKSS